MNPRENYYGHAPSTLRIEERADNVIRFRIEMLGGREAIVDLVADDVRELVTVLQGMATR